MITKLTKKQEQKMYEYQDEGIRIGKSIEPINHRYLEETIIDLYKECGLGSDLRFKYFGSPDSCIKEIIKDKRSSIGSSIGSSIDSSIRSSIVSSIRSSIMSSIDSSIMSSIGSSIMSSIDSSIDSSIVSSIDSSIVSSIDSSIRSSIRSSIWWGQYNINWVQYYSYYNDIIGFKAENQKLLKLLISLTNNSHILFMYDDMIYISERPIKLNLLGNSLHSENNPSLEYADGFKMYHLNGVKVDKKYVMIPADKISVDTILKEENSEIRRELLRKVGIDNFIKKCKSKPIEVSEDGIYELYKVKLGKDKTGMYLKMKNPSIDTYHFEGVIDSCDTIEKALAWRDSEDVYIKPIKLT